MIHIIHRYSLAVYTRMFLVKFKSVFNMNFFHHNFPFIIDVFLGHQRRQPAETRFAFSFTFVVNIWLEAATLERDRSKFTGHLGQVFEKKLSKRKSLPLVI